MSSAVRSARGSAAETERRRAVPQASPLSADYVLQRPVIEGQLRHDVLQTPVLILEFSQPSSLRHLHSPVLRFPPVERVRAHSQAPADLRGRASPLMFLQRRDDLLFCESTLLHPGSPSSSLPGQSVTFCLVYFSGGPSIPYPHFYNYHRAHSAVAYNPPISRLVRNNLLIRNS